MRTCKICNAVEGEVKWVMRYGKPNGRLCGSCKSRASIASAKQDPIKARARQNAWRATKPSYKLEENKAWYRAHPEVANARNAKRRAAKLQRTVAWADAKKIKAIYAKAIAKTKETGETYHVDHKLPLQGKLVSGLHVENNLRVVKAWVNNSKNNTYEIA